MSSYYFQSCDTSGVWGRLSDSKINAHFWNIFLIVKELPNVIFWLWLRNSYEEPVPAYFPMS